MGPNEVVPSADIELRGLPHFDLKVWWHTACHHSERERDSAVFGQAVADMLAELTRRESGI